ncbi:hypothetical protein OC508_18560 [Vibrio vulnificus]|nr:hypothetical protein [Vibrio vulnificus]MCU8399618.1 hypothetical protein [Vibrio vulnificus]HDY7455948.1 hypothetical protein [Vibrio vulnificus]HDY8019688.1 hypothetical protein [Vibrio vulnificus]HDY8061601.1 hypothetical protein [Vibrio vulnificus]
MSDKKQEQKILIVDTKLIHTHINGYQHQLIPPKMKVQALKLAFYLLHKNQLVNHYNQKNDIEITTLSLSQICSEFQTNKKMILAQLEALQHPLITFINIGEEVIYQVDTLFFDSVRITQNDRLEEKQQKEAQRYFIDLHELKSKRSVMGWMFENYKRFYGSKVELKIVFLFELFGYDYSLSKSRENAKKSLGRAAITNGYIYKNYCYRLGKATKKTHKEQTMDESYSIYLSQLNADQDQEYNLSLYDEVYYGQL